MKKEFTTIHSAAFAMMLAASVNCALAQETSTTSIWGNRGQYTTEDTNSEEEALLRSNSYFQTISETTGMPVFIWD